VEVTFVSTLRLVTSLVAVAGITLLAACASVPADSVWTGAPGPLRRAQLTSLQGSLDIGYSLGVTADDAWPFGIDDFSAEGILERRVAQRLDMGCEASSGSIDIAAVSRLGVDREESALLALELSYDLQALAEPADCVGTHYAYAVASLEITFDIEEPLELTLAVGVTVTANGSTAKLLIDRLDENGASEQVILEEVVSSDTTILLAAGSYLLEFEATATSLGELVTARVDATFSFGAEP
jgi:hypothetical protein